MTRYFDHILYIHGYASSLTTPKATELANWAKARNVAFVGLTYSTNANAHDVYESLNKKIEPYASRYTLILGHSLGGFWANYFGQKYSIPVILLNPSVDPTHSLSKYVTTGVKGITIKQEDVDSYTRFIVEHPVTWPNAAGKIVFVAEDDEILPSEQTVAALEHVAEVHTVPSGKHTFSDLTDVIQTLDHIVDHGLEGVE